MRFYNFKTYAKCGLFLILLISLAGTAYADTNQLADYKGSANAGNATVDNSGSENVSTNVHNLTKLDTKPWGIALSWDDSAHIESCYPYLPLFQKYNATCTINVNRVDTRSQAVKDQLKALHEAGWEVACHGYNHLDSRIFLENHTPTQWLNQEIFPNIKESINSGYPVYSLAYPYSSRDPTTDAILAPYFRTLRTDVPDLINGNVNETTKAYYVWDDSQLLYGVEIDDQSSASLESIKYGIDRAKETGSVLVLYGHFINTTVDAKYETSTARLETILDYTTRKGGKYYHLGDLGNTSWVPPREFTVPIANFTVSKNNILPGENVTFVDYSTNQITEKLDFGDGSPKSDTANITHTYTTPGIYTANLTVTNDVTSNSMLQTITVTQPTIPVTNFTSNCTTGSHPLIVAFTDTSTGSPTSWAWDFGDGSTSTDQNPVHEYSYAGVYSVTLTAANEYGPNSIQKVNYISALPQIPSANFGPSGNVPLTVQFNDMSTESPSSWNWDFGDGVTSTEQNPTHTYSAEGTYNVGLVVANAVGNSSKTAAITVQSQTSHSSGGSGGGGAGGSPEPQSNVEIKELSQAFITGGNHAEFDFTQKTTPVISINFDSKKTVGKTTTIAEMLKAKSTLTSDIPFGEVYRYLNIWVGNAGFATPTNIENAVVSFKVEKSWIQDKKIDKSSIIFNRYSDKKWNQLPTTLSSEDDKYLYLTAQTPGFSPFAITGKNTETGTIQPSTDKTQPSVNNSRNNTSTGSTAANTGQTPGQKESQSSSVNGSLKMPGFDMVFGIVSLLAIFLHKRK